MDYISNNLHNLNISNISNNINNLVPGDKFTLKNKKTICVFIGFTYNNDITYFEETSTNWIDDIKTVTIYDLEEII